jgi:hypothetical protein
MLMRPDVIKGLVVALALVCLGLVSSTVSAGSAPDNALSATRVYTCPESISAAGSALPPDSVLEAYNANGGNGAFKGLTCRQLVISPDHAGAPFECRWQEPEAIGCRYHTTAERGRYFIRISPPASVGSGQMRKNFVNCMGDATRRTWTCSYRAPVAPLGTPLSR